MVVRVGVRLAFPGVPGIGRERVGGRADAEKIHGGELAVFVVAILDEAFGIPAVGEEFAVSVGHPDKVVAAIEKGCEIGDLVVFVEVGSTGERPGKQPDGVAGRHLDVLPALPGVDVEEVVEPAVLVGHQSAGVAAESAARTIFGLVAGDPLALGTDAECGEGEAGDAGAAAGFVAFL